MIEADSGDKLVCMGCGEAVALCWGFEYLSAECGCSDATLSVRGESRLPNCWKGLSKVQTSPKRFRVAPWNNWRCGNEDLIRCKNCESSGHIDAAFERVGLHDFDVKVTITCSNHGEREDYVNSKFYCDTESLTYSQRAIFDKFLSTSELSNWLSDDELEIIDMENKGAVAI